MHGVNPDYGPREADSKTLGNQFGIKGQLVNCRPVNWLAMIWRPVNWLPVSGGQRTGYQCLAASELATSV